MTNIQKENKVKLMIGSLVAKANNIKLDSEILCVLVESKHKQKVFVELLVVDLLNKILNYSTLDLVNLMKRFLNEKSISYPRFMEQSPQLVSWEDKNLLKKLSII